ncbi:MAG: hypothetical protein ACOYB8_00840 [Eubacteriaceae bacterium]|jgi:hypothetical protein
MEDFYYYSQVPSSADQALSRCLMVFGGVIIGIIAVVGVYALLCYIFQSVGLYHMAKNRGIKHAWWSWIPIMNYNIIGELINDEIVFGKDIVMKRAAFWLPVIAAAGLTVTGIPYLSYLLIFAVWLVEVSALWRLFKIYNPKSYVAFTVWSLFLSPGFFIFAIKDNEPYDPFNPNKVYKDYFEEKKEIDDAERHANKEIDSKVQEKEAAIEKTYQDAVAKEGVTDEEKEAARKTRDEELKDLHERARIAKEDNARTAHEFTKMAEDSPTDQIFQSEVEEEIVVKQEDDNE